MTLLQAPGERRVGLLGGGILEHKCADDRINVTFPDVLDVWPAHALKITPKPQLAGWGVCRPLAPEAQAGPRRRRM